MTFRDDHDAALARADALEGEVERTKRERDALAAKVKELESTRPEPEKEKERIRPSGAASLLSDDPDRNDKKSTIWAFSFVGIAVVVIAVLLIPRSCQHSRDLEEWTAKSAARKAHKQRWSALVSVENCLRRIAWDSMSARRHTPDKEDPRKANIWPFTDGVVGNCRGGAASLVGDPKTAQAVKSALGKWLDVQQSLEAPTKALAAYYGNQDWKEDNFASAPERWKPVLGLMIRQVAAMATVRKDALPAIRAEVRDYLATHETTAGRDETYWRGALTLQLWEINDRAYEVAGIYAGREPDHDVAAKAIQAQVIQFLELAKQAPIEVRREIRKLDWITSRIVAGDPLTGETPLWHLANADDEWIGRGSNHIAALPPDPGKRPEDPTGD